MKIVYFVGLAITLYHAYARRLLSLNDDQKACIQQLNLDEGQISGLYFGYGTTEDNAQYNDFLFCSWQRMGFQDENGVINYDKLKRSFDIGGKVGEDAGNFLSRMKELTFDSVSICEKNPPALGITHGQTVARIQNCIIDAYQNATYRQLH